MTSVPFLVITFIIYAYFQELKNLHGKCLMSYILSLTVMFTSLSTVMLKNNILLEHYQITCKAVGYLLMLSVLMCFFWINVLCYDIFSAFRWEFLTDFLNFELFFKNMKKFLTVFLSLKIRNYLIIFFKSKTFIEFV